MGAGKLQMRKRAGRLCECVRWWNVGVPRSAGPVDDRRASWRDECAGGFIAGVRVRMNCRRAKCGFGGLWACVWLSDCTCLC